MMYLKRFHVKPPLPVLDGNGLFYLPTPGRIRVRLPESMKHTVGGIEPEVKKRNFS